MDEHDEAYNRTPSTRWRPAMIKMPRAPQASRTVTEGRHWFFRLPRRDARTPLTIRIHYRGGSECWYEIKARGGTLRVPGVRALHDVMSIINDGGGTK